MDLLKKIEEVYSRKPDCTIILGVILVVDEEFTRRGHGRIKI
jgi:hypothetical protein